MKLLVRVNLALGAVFALGALGAGWVCAGLLRADARTQALVQARLMMDGANAVRTYTASEIVPLLGPQMKETFLPQSVPSYAAVQNFLIVHDAHPGFAYREATLNPTNPRDRAADWEADVIQRLAGNPALPELDGERATPMGASLFLARPIKAEPACLACHDVAANAPPTLLARYGPNNGFGWHPGEVVGAQIVSVPLAVAEAGADQALRTFIGFLVAVFVLLMLVLNVVLWLMVARPVRRMASNADALSLGDMSTPEFPASGGDEIAALGGALNRLRTSLEKALRMLGS